jgi:hypothetical protein
MLWGGRDFQFLSFREFANKHVPLCHLKRALCKLEHREMRHYLVFREFVRVRFHAKLIFIAPWSSDFSRFLNSICWVWAPSSNIERNSAVVLLNLWDVLNTVRCFTLHRVYLLNGIRYQHYVVLVRLSVSLMYVCICRYLIYQSSLSYVSVCMCVRMYAYIFLPTYLISYLSIFPPIHWCSHLYISVFWHPVVDSIITFNLIRQHH